MSDYEESEIEASFDYCGNFMNVDKARAELAALRAQAAEAETLRATVAAYKFNEKIRDNDLSDILAGDRTIIERQARQLEYMKHILVNEFGCAPAVVDAWLAANAPAQTKAEETP